MNCVNIVLLLCFCITGIVGYSVTGNKIKDPNGNQVLLRGVDRPSFEWNINGESASASDYALMRAWGANVVRVSLNQDFWMGSSYSTYQRNIDQQISWATATGMGVILDLHWNNGGQQNMADRNSITFWSQVAGKYKDNAWVMFELYNEPHDVSWSQWLSGDGTYAGMQEMYTAVRTAGATNLVLVCGLNWAFDLSGVSNGYALQGNNIAYATHPYDYPGKQIGDWPVAFGNLAATYPVVMTEFGQYCATNTYVADLLAYCQTNGIHWTAWAWYVSGCSFPSIIADWNGTPSSGVGQLVKSYLSGNAPATPIITPTSPPAVANSAMTVFSDSLGSGWQDWSWASSYSLLDSTYVRTGSKSIKFTVQGYGGIYLHTTTSFASGAYASVQFYVNGGTSAISSTALSVKLYGASGSVVGNSVNFPASVPASQWSLISVPLSSFGVSSGTQLTGIVIQANVDASAGTVWIDDISFVPAASSTSAPTSAPTTRPTSAPTNPPTAAPTTRPPTSAPTVAPTRPPTSAPTAAPTAPTTRPTAAPTTAPTTRPPTAAPTAAPGGCDISSVQLTQTAGGSWAGFAPGTTVTQYALQISTTCPTKTLVALTMTATNWNAINFWNAVATPTGTAGQVTVTLPSYAAITRTSPFSVGYQNIGGQASFTVTSATFQ